ncbi:ABC transporter substrate-binding protein [Azonexus sp. IMCC34839]|uniref:ABC transporter substrate-binding protein n=1 Tax=Azonexus sp. IMCC34839 TaxID=3133695 RepID=UPI00399ABBF8
MPISIPFSALRRALSMLFLASLLQTASAKELLVVQVAPLSGPQGVTGKAVQAGAKLYFDHINAQGGVGGNTIKLISRDDENKPEETVRLVKESLANEQPVAFIGSVGTNNVEALIRDGSLARANTPLIGPLSGASSMIGAPATYVVKASYRDEVDSLFKQLSQTGQSKVGLVYQDDSLGKDVLTGAEQAAPKYNIQLAARAGYERNTLKVENAVDSMLKAAPQSIFLGATTAAAIEFVRQYRQKGGIATIYGMSIIDTQQLLAKLGPSLARGYAFSVVMPLENKTTLPLIREYSRLKESSKDANLTARSIEGFIAAKALVNALKQGGNSGPATAKALSGSKIDLGGYSLDFTSSKRTGSTFVDFAMIGDNGRIVQ